MARRATTLTPEPATETPEPAITLTITESAGVPRASKEGSAQTDPWYPTVLKGYRDSRDSNAARSFPNLPTKKTAERIVQLLMAAYKNTPGTSLRKAISGSTDVGYSVDFKVSTETHSRNYTVNDVREWARTNGYNDDKLVPRVHADVRTAYRKAHGLPVKEEKTTAK